MAAKKKPNLEAVKKVVKKTTAKVPGSGKKNNTPTGTVGPPAITMPKDTSTPKAKKPAAPAKKPTTPAKKSTASVTKPAVTPTKNPVASGKKPAAKKTTVKKPAAPKKGKNVSAAKLVGTLPALDGAVSKPDRGASAIVTSSKTITPYAVREQEEYLQLKQDETNSQRDKIVKAMRDAAYERRVEADEMTSSANLAHNEAQSSLGEASKVNNQTIKNAQKALNNANKVLKKASKGGSKAPSKSAVAVAKAQKKVSNQQIADAKKAITDVASQKSTASSKLNTLLGAAERLRATSKSIPTLKKAMSVFQGRNEAERDLAKSYQDEIESKQKSVENNALARGMSGQIATAQEKNDISASLLADKKKNVLKRALETVKADREIKQQEHDTLANANQQVADAQSNTLRDALSGIESVGSAAEKRADKAIGQRKSNLAENTDRLSRINGIKVDIEKVNGEIALAKKNGLGSKYISSLNKLKSQYKKMLQSEKKKAKRY